MRNSLFEQRPSRRAPDSSTVDDECLYVSCFPSFDDGGSGSVMWETVVGGDEIGVGVLGHFGSGYAAVGAELGPDTATAGVDVDGSLASCLESLFSTGEQSLRASLIEDIRLAEKKETSSMSSTNR